MNIGDRVRLMSGREEGIVTRILDQNLVEVTIDDFPVPVLRSELVLVAAEEFKAFGGSELAPSQVAAPRPLKPGKAGKAPAAPTATTTPTGTTAVPAKAAPAPPAPKGLYLALVQQTSELLVAHLINNTDAEVLFTFGEERGGQYRALAAAQLAPKTVSQPLGHRHLKDFDQWATAVVQLLPAQLNSPVLYDVLLKRVSFKASTFYSSRREAPVIKREAYLFQLDEKPAAAIPVPTTDEPKPAPAPAVNPAKLRDQLAEKLRGDAKAVVPAPKPEPAKAIVPPPHEVDLHLEALQPEGGTEGLSNTAVLELQTAAFEDALSRALATNMHEIVFIHGVGNGTLRKELHKRLSRNRDIKFFEEARKEKFGYGATLVRLK